MLIIGGPCAVESKEQLESVVSVIKDNVHAFRAGAFKPRTRHSDFQGLGVAGLEIIKQVSTKYSLPSVSEIVSIESIADFYDVDYLQIGARNMQNYELLKAVGKMRKVVILKRGFANTVDEFIASANYLVEFGAKEVILCERGIRTISDSSRFTLDLSCITKIHNETDFKIIVDPSHAGGTQDQVRPLALAAVAAGADGLIIETHNQPQNALSDANQQILPADFNQLIAECWQVYDVVHNGYNQ